MKTTWMFAHVLFIFLFFAKKDKYETSIKIASVHQTGCFYRKRISVWFISMFIEKRKEKREHDLGIVG